MRKSEITDELIALSKRAKELGFPQDLQEGDWYWCNSDQRCYVIDELSYEEEQAINDSDYPEDFLILTFSTCLAWLRGQGYEYIDCLYDGYDTNWSFFAGQIDEERCMKKDHFTKAKTHHEAIAKCVIKVLEEK